MKLRISIFLLALPFAVLAKEDNIAEDAIQRLEENAALTLDDDALESLKEISDNLAQSALFVKNNQL